MLSLLFLSYTTFPFFLEWIFLPFFSLLFYKPNLNLIHKLHLRYLKYFSIIFFLFYFSKRFFYFFKYIYWLCYYSCPISPPTPLHPAHLLPPTFPAYSSCPWVILISSLASTFPTLFLPSRRLFATYLLCYLFSVPVPPSPLPTPLLTTLHVISISMVLFLF